MNQPTIRVLDEHTANKIAAGEVVERPASVVKELVENSLDAFSKKIDVFIQGGGIESIRVTDDGVGMSRADAELAILRHATSKISSADDLHSIHSLGFRGEALPSIASVSRFSLTTRLHEADMATLIAIAGGKIIDIREAGSGVGTSITIDDLFFNTPARRKFLKTPDTEKSYIQDIVGRIALSHPDVGFQLTNNQRLVLKTPGNGNLLDTLACLYGSKIVEQVLPVQYNLDGISVTGYIAKPTLVKSSRHWQTFIVNHRVISSRMIAKALDNAYHSLLPRAGFPLAVVQLMLNSENIDVNVHPQKSEIKFSDEQVVYKAVYRAIANALTHPDSSQIVGDPALLPKLMPPSWTIPQSQQSIPIQLWQEGTTTEALPSNHWQYSNNCPDMHSASPDNSATTLLTPFGQIDGCYIVASGPEGLYIIDQHAAHERIIYDRLSQPRGQVVTQQLLIPPILDFDNREMRLIETHQPILAELGFLFDLAGPNTLRLMGLPLDVATEDVPDFMQDILALLQNHQTPTAATLRHGFIQIASCRGAIKAGCKLSFPEMKVLLAELFATAHPYTCPHGRPVIVHFGPDQLAKLFKRT